MTAIDHETADTHEMAVVHRAPRHARHMRRVRG
jgi:hypothetical protein